MLLMSIIAVANMSPASRPKTTPGTVTCAVAGVAAGQHEQRHAADGHGDARSGRCVWRRVRSTNGASSATNTGAMYSSETPTVTLEDRIETK